MASLVWFRIDLRLADHPALTAAVRRGEPIVPVFIWAPEEENPWEPGAASRWWLHQSLNEMGAQLRAKGSRLILRRGPTLSTLRLLIRETGANAVYWSRRYELAVMARDAEVEAALRKEGVATGSFNGALLHEPGDIRNKSGKPFQVFTPYWRHCLTLGDLPEPLPAPRRLPAPKQWPKSLALAELELEPRIRWDRIMRQTWQPGEHGAKRQLKQFLARAWPAYSESRNRPDRVGTSRLSPHLHFGEITPRQVWHAARKKSAAAPWRNSQYLAELGWREFAHHLLVNFPTTPAAPLRPDFGRFPWRTNPAFLKAWQQGCTGYPMVDAGMRELWATGFMHNRARMITASFLVKDLLLTWQAGAEWFWDTLVDADLAQNTLGWQWSAGCGADAAPFFRIFNPVAQGVKFDPKGDYVRKWCPELAALPDAWIHQPHLAPAEVAARAGVVLGETYPRPIVNHTIAREVALEAYGKIKRNITSGK